MNVVTNDNASNKYTQDSSANTLSFDNDTTTYEYAKIRLKVNNYVASLTDINGVSTLEVKGRLLTKDELTQICQRKVSTWSSDTLPTGVECNLAGTNYWLGDDYNYNLVWVVSDNNLSTLGPAVSISCGLRPVILIPKS